MKHAINYTDCTVHINDPQTNTKICTTRIKEHNRHTNTILLNASAFSYLPKNKVDILIPIRSQNHHFDGFAQRGYIKSVVQIALNNFELKESREAPRFRLQTQCDAYKAMLPPTAKENFHKANRLEESELSFQLAVTRVPETFKFEILDLSASGFLISVDTDRVFVGTTFSFTLDKFANYDLIIVTRVVRINNIHGVTRELGCVFLTSEKVAK